MEKLKSKTTDPVPFAIGFFFAILLTLYLFVFNSTGYAAFYGVEQGSSGVINSNVFAAADTEEIEVIPIIPTTQPLAGIVSVYSEPKADVFINGVFKGNSSPRLYLKDIPPGKVELRIGMVQGYYDKVLNITVESNKTVNFDITLDKTPEQALYDEALSLFHSGSYEEARNKFQQLLNEFSGEDYLLGLSDDSIYWIAESYFSEADYNNAANYYDQLITQYPDSERIAAARIRRIQCEAQSPPQGTLYIRTVPPGAKIYINGKDYGNTGMAIKIFLQSGNYTAMLIKSHYSPYTSFVEIRAGETTELNVHLKPN